MERRFDKRFPSNLQVRVADLDNDDDFATGSLLDISVSGICVLLPILKPTGSLVKLDLAGTVLYGQVAYAHEESDNFRTGILVERVLVKASDLSHILESILADSEPSVLPIRG